MTTAQSHRRTIYGARDLPTLPIIAQKILCLADDDDTSAKKLADIISSDPALAVKVLSLANSAYYGHRNRVGTIRQAVVVIGSSMLRQLSLSVLVFKALDITGSGRQRIWHHSLMAAHAAAWIGRLNGNSSPDLCYMGGLLHDIGALVLDSTLPVQYAEIRSLTDTQGWDSVEAERYILETDHAEVGAWMAARWQLPSELTEAIGRHHTPPEASASEASLATVIYAADRCTTIAEQLSQDSTAVDGNTPPLIAGVKPDQFHEIIGRLLAAESEVRRFLS